MKTKLFSLLCTLMCAGNLFAYDFYVNGIYYNRLGGGSVEVTYKTTDYNSYSGSVTIPETVTYSNTTYRVTTIGNSAFSWCIKLTSITIPNSVTTIGEKAFVYCRGLTSVTIPNSVTTIGNSAFLYCSGLTSVTIPNSVTTIGTNAFSMVNNIVYSGTPSGSTWGAKCVNGYVDGYLVYSDASKNKLCGCSTAATGEIVIPSSVTTIGEDAFWKCHGLTSIIISNSVTTIGDNAFYDCSGLTSVTIGSSVKTIGDYAFEYCSGLTSITCYATTPPTCDSYCFYEVDNTIPVYVPARSVDAYKQAKGWKDFTNLQASPFVFVTCNIIGNGTSTGMGYYKNGDTCTLYAIADEHYHFVQWTDSVTDNPRSFVVTQDTTFTAEFAKNQYLISVEAENGVISGGGYYEYQSYAQLTATADEHYHFVKWNDENTDNPRTISVTEDKNYTAIFAIDQHSVSAVADHGNVSGIGTYNYGSEISLMVTPSYGYHFTQWTDSVTDNPRSFVVTQDTSFIAQCDKNTYTISTAVNDDQRGVVQGGNSALYLDEITLTAVANYGYHFTRWTDGNTDNPRKVVVKEDKTYTARFDKNQYVVTVNKDEHIQSIIGAGTYEYLDEITLSVTAETYYRFDRWADGNTDNPRVLVVSQDTTLTALSVKVTEGPCGEGLTWKYGDGVLVISGTGAMYDYTQGTAPWMPLFKDSISSLVINNGCTTIGNFAFYGLSNKNLKTIDIPNGVEQIGQFAFANCEYVKNVYLGLSLEKISANAFANDERLLYITCFAIEPPLLDESAFVNYDAYLSVPCESLADYKVAKGWKLFNKESVSCIGAEEKPITGDDVTVTPSTDNATIVWPANDAAAEYTLEITKDGVVFCTLRFNAQGQLIGIAFASSRDGELRTMSNAEMTATGWSFTVTGLNPGSTYSYTVDVIDAQKQSIRQYTGSFTTTGGVVTSLPTLMSTSVSGKILYNGHLYIQRDGNLFTATGARVK